MSKPMPGPSYPGLGRQGALSWVNWEEGLRKEIWMEVFSVGKREATSIVIIVIDHAGISQVLYSEFGTRRAATPFT